jgi:Xaa-Pro aminopeptidase
MDVHDTHSLPTNVPFADGMVVTVEPGLYIPHDDLLAPEQYRGIGIRVEDDILITSSEPLVLTREIPKSVGDIERAMRK